MRIFYQYNEETCQYERIGLKVPDVIFYISGIVVTAVAILAGMLVLHDYFIDSPKEVGLRQENVALRKNYALLTRQLDHIESGLQALQQEDQKLQSTLFGVTVKAEEKEVTALHDRTMLLSSPNGFRKNMRKITERSDELLERSFALNSYFSGRLSIDESAVKDIATMPFGQPIQPWTTSSVFSGFGMRINPFHKGLYEHPGIDITMPRGTDVVTTAPGKVIAVNKATVQAGYGNYIDVDHGNGFVTRYAHLDEIRVRLHQRLERGAVIGTVGSTGGSVAPHLHYEIIKDGKPVNPAAYMIAGLDSKSHEQLVAISKIQNQSLD